MSLDRLLAVSDVEADGLMVTTAGTYVRTVGVQAVAQPLTAGAEGRRRHRARMLDLASRMKAHQSMQITVQSDPIAIEHVIDAARRDVEAAAAAAIARGEHDLAVAMRRLHAGEAQTLTRYAQAQAAQQLGYYVTVPWRPGPDPLMYRRRGPQPRWHRRPQQVEWADHHRAARDSLRAASGVLDSLSSMEPWLLDGTAQLALLRNRLMPGAGMAPERFAGLPRITPPATAEEARERRAELLRALASDFAPRFHRADLLHASGAIERTMRVDTSPEATTAWWLLPILELPLPYRLTVHLHATDRARERFLQRARRRRLRATTLTRYRRGMDISPEHEEAEAEARQLDAELRSSARAGLWDVSMYLTVLDPDGDTERLDEITDTIGREFTSLTDATLRPSIGFARGTWASTLPLGIDRLGATRRYAARNVADVVPLIGTRCGTPGGVPVGFAAPGRTLELLDPYDSKFTTSVGVITGLSGRGKTLTSSRLIKSWIARGGTVRIIDRSSVDDQAAGAARGMGHYEPLASLIPGAQIVRMGAKGGPVICPWDVADAAAVPATKLSFLGAIHSLLIGQRSAGTQDRVLTATEESLLARAIESVYLHASETGERPCEQLLLDRLAVLAEQAASAGNGEAAATYRLLAERLEPYGESGTYSHLLNDPTTVPDDAPLIVYDLGGIDTGLGGPIALTIAEREERLIGARRGKLLRGELPRGGSWTGRTAVIIDECWSQLAHDTAGQWLNEWARRVRHIATALVAITQHLSDFKNEQGRALLRQAQWNLVFGADDDELSEVRADLGLSAEEQEIIGDLTTIQGQFASAYLVSKRGRGTVRIQLADLEYWMCSADPRRDQPLRSLALRQTGDDAWQALRLLVDPDWHADHRDLVASV